MYSYCDIRYMMTHRLEHEKKLLAQNVCDKPAGYMYLAVMHVEIKGKNECYGKERMNNTKGKRGRDDGIYSVRKTHGVSLLGVVSETDGSDKDGMGTEYRARRPTELLYSDDERSAESCRKRGNARSDWIRSRSSEAFIGESASNQMDGMSAGVALAAKGWGLSSGKPSSDSPVTPPPS